MRRVYIARRLTIPQLEESLKFLAVRHNSRMLFMLCVRATSHYPELTPPTLTARVPGALVKVRQRHGLWTVRVEEQIITTS